MSSPEGAANTIAQLETRMLDESTAAIMVALNFRDRSTAGRFVKDVVHKVLLERMTSPPDTALLCITIMGNVTASEFAQLWRKHVYSEPAMVAFMKRMRAADVINGTPQGQVLEQVSLIAAGG
jgi:hypothetical protein